MKLIKRCACGATIEVYYTAPRSEYARDDARDRQDALDQIKAWDRLHKAHYHYREALEWIADHSQEMTLEIHGYKGYGQALGAVHNRARNAVDPPTASVSEGNDG